jgi:error-prone DNA polymerase
VVCYLLGITAVAPEQIDSLFERFISEKRNEPPDIDVDFEHQRREEVMAYIYEKYKEKHTALACAVISYRGRSALREVAKAMGLSQDVQGALSGSIWGWWTTSIGSEQAKAGGLDKEDPITRHVLARANELVASECPRHLSQHVGGFVITRDRLDEIVPIVRTGMETRRMVEWNKDDLDAVGILKVDVLALGMLSCMKRAFTLLEDHYRVRDEHGRPITLATMRKEDPLVYDMICRADTLGVFQVESRAQMSMLPRLKPRRFYDLVIEVAIVRPGPIQGDMVHPYLRRRERKEEVDYPKPELEEILGKTLGVPLFQEQAMKIAIVAGGFTPDEADLLRRAMATFRRNGTIGNYEKRMISGMVKKGYPEEFAKRCFRQIEGFGDYGFPESHAASFALLVYASCWFKAFYPDVFCAAILNSQPMGFYKPAQLIRDAAEHGVEIRAVDINASGWECTLEKAAFDPSRVAERHVEMRRTIRTMHALRMGFNQIRGLAEKRMETFVACRGDGYVSVRDVWLRSGLDAGEIGKLAEADAFRSIGLDRRAALWAVRALDTRSAVKALPLFDRPGLDLPDREPVTRLPATRPGEQVVQDYRSLGLSLKAHPVSFLRARLDRAGVTPNVRLGALSDGARVTVSGLVLVRQRPGKGNAIFLTLEDEGAIANIIVWPRIFERYRAAIMGGRFVRVTGKLQAETNVIHIVAGRVEDLSSWLGALLHEGPAPECEDVSSIPAEKGRQALARNAHSVMPKGRNFH